MDRSAAQRIWTLIEPVVAHQGYEVVEVEVHPGRHGSLRVFLDGPQGIGVDKCAEFSRTFSSLLDVEDPIKGRYTLEVSSPGLDRPLRKPEHFRKAVGQEVALKLEAADGSKKKLRGVLRDVLTAATETTLSLVDTQKHSHDVALSTVDSAHVVHKFPAPGQKASSRAKPARRANPGA